MKEAPDALVAMIDAELGCGDRLRIDGGCVLWTGPMDESSARPLPAPALRHTSRSTVRRPYAFRAWVGQDRVKGTPYPLVCGRLRCISPWHSVLIARGKRRVMAIEVIIEGGTHLGFGVLACALCSEPVADHDTFCSEIMPPQSDRGATLPHRTVRITP